MIEPLEQKSNKKFFLISFVIVVLIFVSFAIYLLFIKSPLEKINTVEITQLTNQFITEIKTLETSPVNIDGNKVLKGLPEYLESEISDDMVKIHPQTGLEYISNELDVYAKNNFDQDILISQIHAVGADIISYKPSVRRFIILFPKNISFEQFSAAQSALEASNQVDFVALDLISRPT